MWAEGILVWFALIDNVIALKRLTSIFGRLDDWMAVTGSRAVG